MKAFGVRCPRCLEVIVSLHRHDFRRCKCKATFVDGGRDYLRYGGEQLDLIERVEVDLKGNMFVVKKKAKKKKMNDDTSNFSMNRLGTGRENWTIEKYEEAFQLNIVRQRKLLLLGDKLADLLEQAAFRSTTPPEIMDQASGLLTEWDALVENKELA